MTDAASHSERPAEPLTLAHLLHIFGSYRYALAIAVAALAMAFVIVAAAILLWLPAQHTTSLNFRLNFQGADRGEYPNGEKFSSADIVGVPVLRQVFAQNQVGRYMAFDDFKTAFFIIETNPQSERLAREYEARLSDARLSPVDRDRLEREYKEKQASLSHAEYQLTLVHSDRTLVIPGSVMLKSISDILPVWAEQAERDRGVTRYPIELFTKNVLDPRILQSDDAFITADMMRTKFKRVNTALNTLMKVPGSVVLRLEPTRTNLSDIRSNLDDMSRFRLNPMLSAALAFSSSRHAAATLRYLEAQLSFAQRKLDEARTRTEAVKGAINAYNEAGPAPQVPVEKGTTASAGAAAVVPQLGETFINELSRILSRSQDLEYRQHLIDRLAQISVDEVAPLSEEVAYYRDQIQAFKAGGAVSIPNDQSLRDQASSLFQDLGRSIEQINQIYGMLYQNLNSPSALYTMTSGVRTVNERRVSIKQLFLWGVLLFLIAIPILLVLVMVHHRVREEELSEPEQFDARLRDHLGP